MQLTKYLILTYFFPPDGDIGGRRWAKFAKHLTSQGHQVDVLTRSFNGENNTKWLSDTDSYQSKINYFNDGYPTVLTKSNLTIWDKVKYKIALRSLEKRVKGNYYDPTCMLGADFLELVSKLISAKQIDAVIVSGFPFYWQYLLTSIKASFPKTKFIADFRDPWLNNQTGYGYKELDENRFNMELAYERSVIEHFDGVFSVSNEMNDYFNEIAPEEPSSKFFEVTNGYDNSDRQLLTENSQQNEKVTIIYTGSLYNGLEYILPEFITALKLLEKHEELDFEFKFFGTTSQKFQDDIAGLNKVTFYGKVPLERAHQELAMADYALIFLNKDLLFSRSTKLYEALSYGKKIILVASDGATAAFLTNRDLGYHCSEGNVLSTLKEIIARGRPETGSMLPGINQFNIEEIAKKIDVFVNQIPLT